MSVRALVLREYGQLVVEELPDPVLRDGEVLVRIAATGICGSDIHGYTGHTGRRQLGQVMGHETGGTVEHASGGSRLEPGSRVTVNPVIYCGACAACRAGREQICVTRQVIGVDPGIRSAFAELLVVPERNVVPLAVDLPIEYGALVEPLAVGYHAAMRGGCGPGDRVVVVGGGPIGQACWLAARRLGADAVVSEVDPQRQQLLRRLGADVVDALNENVAQAVAARLGGPASLAFDAVGSTESLADCLGATDLGAPIVLVGMHDPQLNVNAYALSTGERAVIGTFCYSAQDFRSTAEWAPTAADQLEVLVERTVGLDQAPATFAAAADGRGGPGKILVRLR